MSKQLKMDLSGVPKVRTTSGWQKSKWNKAFDEYCNEQLTNGNADKNGYCACGYMNYCDYCKAEYNYKCHRAYTDMCRDKNVEIDYNNFDFDKLL